MQQIIECVANVSEGRDATVLDALTNAIRGVTDVRLLDRHTDWDHHRSVFTFAGRPEAVIQAVFELVQTALPLIDLNTHRGEHPRVGAVDVVPLIPLKGATMKDCIEWAGQLGEQIGTDLHIPVFLYEAACVVPTRQRLEMIRRGGTIGLASRMASHPQWIPDFGPGQPHPTAGVVIVGARHPLIAFNVVLKTPDVSIAQSIAKTIRTSGGGLPSLKAIGIGLASRGLAQVSMNLTNFHETLIQDAFDAVQQEAEKFHVCIEESEIVGLIPQDALPPHPQARLQLRSWNPDQVLETGLSHAGIL
ncbi:MAG: glutamate formimidoyltransferase [Nitrospirota bacterium]|nr:MAG: glutamate formimidoyltransferase [Nitrospirota bacterium]